MDFVELHRRCMPTIPHDELNTVVGDFANLHCLKLPFFLVGLGQGLDSRFIVWLPAPVQLFVNDHLVWVDEEHVASSDFTCIDRDSHDSLLLIGLSYECLHR